MSSTAFTYSYLFKMLFLLSECDRTLPPLCYTQPNLFKFFMCVLFETRSKSSLCPCQLKNLRTKLLTYLIQNFGFALRPFRIPRNTYLFTHDLTRSPLLSTWVTHVMRMRRVRGKFVQFLRVNSFSPRLYIPLPFLTSLLLRSTSLPLELLKP